MECDLGFSFFIFVDVLWEGVMLDFKVDVEKIFEEVKEWDKLVDEDNLKVKVDLVFSMEGGGYVCRRLYRMYIRY